MYVLTSGVKSYTPLISTKPLARWRILSSSWSNHPENKSMATRCAPAEWPQNHTDLSTTESIMYTLCFTGHLRMHKCTTWKLGSSHSSVAQDSSVFRCDSVSMVHSISKYNGTLIFKGSRRHHDPSKSLEPYTQPHNVTSKNTWILRNANVRMT